jgi:hypothetical protein
MDLTEIVNSRNFVFICIFAMAAVVALPCVIGYYLTSARESDHKARQAEAELALKQDMIKRGMSAEEIERVLKASKEEKTA